MNEIDYASRQAQHIDYDNRIQLIQSDKITRCYIHWYACELISEIKYYYIHQNNYDKLASIVQAVNNKQISCTITYSSLLSKLPNKFYQYVTIELEIYGKNIEKTINEFLDSDINCKELRLLLFRPQDSLLYMLDYAYSLLERKKINRFIAVYECNKCDIYLKKILSHHIMQYKKSFDIDSCCYSIIFEAD